MSQTGKSTQEMGSDSLATRFRDLLSSKENKPGFKELDLGSPVSPLKTRAKGNAAGAGASNTSSGSSSSSTGSRNTIAKLPKKPDGRPRNNCGELPESSSNASESLRSASASRNTKPGHRRSVSAGAPLIYSGGSFSSSGNNCHANVATPATYLFPTGNVFLTGKILKPDLVSRASNRTDVLGSGTVNYGRGNIMRSGGKLSNGGHIVVDDNVTGNSQLGGVSAIVKQAMGGYDPEEVKKSWK